MNWTEAYTKFAEWHQKYCKTKEVTAINGVGGCYASGVEMIAELRCELCKDTFYVKYITGPIP